jgi:predicted metal-dependent hydrolase
MMKLFSSRNLTPDAAPEVLSLEGREVPVRYRHNERARRIIVRMERQFPGIVITVPPGTSRMTAFEFATSQRAWIWQRLAVRDHPADPERIEGSEIPVRGIAHVIERCSGRGAPVHLRDLPRPALVVRGDDAHLKRRITDFLKRLARDDLERSSSRYAETMGVSYSRLSVRDASTRWGSCSSTGTLCYSWRLIMAPPMVLDYVCAHEVAHLLEMNHSPAFWQLVERHCPHTARAKLWLKRQGHSLQVQPV